MKPSGVRFVYTLNNNTFSNDIEPEYIVLDEAANKVYAVLQVEKDGKEKMQKARVGWWEGAGNRVKLK